MPQDGDQLQFTIITTLEGVAMRNNIYPQVTALGTNDNLADVAGILGQEFIDVTLQVLTTQVQYVAFIVDNLSRNEVRGIITADNTGNLEEGAHPQDQVLRFNEWAPDDNVNEMRRGAFNLSGVGESFSQEGRLREGTEFQSLELFLSTQFLDSTTGLTTVPMIRRRIPASQPPAYTFHRISKAEVNPTFFKLKSRKTTILGL